MCGYARLVLISDPKVFQKFGGHVEIIQKFSDPAPKSLRKSTALFGKGNKGIYRYSCMSRAFMEINESKAAVNKPCRNGQKFGTLPENYSEIQGIFPAEISTSLAVTQILQIDFVCGMGRLGTPTQPTKR